MSPHSDTVSWFRANQSLLFLLNVFGLTWTGLEPMIYHTWCKYANHYTTDEFQKNLRYLQHITRLRRDHILVWNVQGSTLTVVQLPNASSGKWKRHPTWPIGQAKMILWYVEFLKSKMINIELFSVGSCDEFYLNIVSYVSCILHHFVLFCWLRNSPFSNKDRVIYISQSQMPN